MGFGTKTGNKAGTKAGTKAGDNSANHSAASKLLEHPDLWRAGQLGATPDTLTTGFPQLDAQLPGNGWPRGGLGEFLLNTTGVGELRLLAPLLKQVSRSEARWIAWVNPPFVPYAPALEALGIDISRILLIHPKDHKDALWVMERASKSGSCSVVLGWLDEQKLNVKDTRRLQLAARQGRTFACLFRPERAAAQNSMAELRLQVSAPLRDQEPGELNVSINKRRGGWPVTGLCLSVSDARKPAEIREQLSLWQNKERRNKERQNKERQNKERRNKGRIRQEERPANDHAEPAGDMLARLRQPDPRVTH